MGGFAELLPRGERLIGMSHRHLLIVAAAATSFFAGCSQGSIQSAAGPSSEARFPTDPDVAIVRIGFDQSYPTLVIGGDGWAYSAAEHETERSSPEPGGGPVGFRSNVTGQPEMAPAPPEPLPMERQRLSPRGLQIVVELADDLGLLAPPDVYEDPQITDVGSTFVRLINDEGTFEHTAHALGYDDETGNRQKLLDFVEAMENLELLVGADNIGPVEPYVPIDYRVAIVGSFATEGLAVSWPHGLSVEEGCVQLPIERFPDGAAGSFIATVDGEPTRVIVIPAVPGDACDEPSSSDPHGTET